MIHPADTIPWEKYNDFLHLDLFIPGLITVSEANKTGEHWAIKHQRHTNQQRLLLKSLKMNHVMIPLPAHVVFIRHSPRLLDPDNLTQAFKHFKDYLSDYLLPGLKMGMADAKIDITFSYSQMKSKIKGIGIQAYGPKDRTNFYPMIMKDIREQQDKMINEMLGLSNENT